jgi:two-component system cell cycle sensor histidine kinase/response regulator CckA
MASASVTRPIPIIAADPCRWTVLIDPEGKIQFSDGRWPMVNAAFPLGADYYQFLAMLCGENHDRKAAVCAAIRAVAEAQVETFNLDFACRLADRSVVMHLRASVHRKGVLLVHTEAVPESETEASKMEALGRLTGGVVHDFANLLTLISGYSGIILNRLADCDPLRVELEEIRKATVHGFGMTSQILDFVRKPVALPTAVNLNKLVEEMETTLQPIIGEHIRLRTELDPGLEMVNATPAQISRVVMNLVLNARDAMPRGGSISLRTANRGKFVALEVADTGCGMDPKTLRQIFKPFFTRKPAGTGLGLNNVRGIVQQMGGDIQVRSEPGQGATFVVCMPRADRGGEINPTDSLRRSPGTNSETILLVEDEESVRKLLKHLLSVTGYHVLEAKDGSEALDIFQQHSASVDLLLTDVMMPGMNGRELAEEAMAIKPELKVIYMSGYTDDVLSNAGSPGPGMSFLRKPLKLDVLSTMIREMLDAPAPL